jgi:DNA-binding CsgD family transcriptional regulator
MTAPLAVLEETSHPLQAVDAISGAGDLRQKMAGIAMSYGFAGAVYVHLGHGLRAAADPNATFVPRRLLATHGFDEVQYLRRNHLAHDPIAIRAVQRHAPFAWTLDDLLDADPGRRRVVGVMQSWGMQVGLVAPVQDYACGPAFLNLFGPASKTAVRGTHADLGQLMLLAVQVHAEAAKVLPGSSEFGPDAELNTREMEVLRLAAIGKTEQDTALTLTLSRRGVQFHLARAMEKLGAVNKTAAVARAISAGLISV